MRPKLNSFGLAVACLAMLALPLRADKVVLEYWDKWNGMEGDAMQAIVNDFNASQDRIEVHYSSISLINVKVMMSVAGRNPPDVAGIYDGNLPAYVDNNALQPLDALAAQAGIKQADYLASVWGLCFYRDHLFALPSTPTCAALHWNKRLFREAGLDPERPPRTIAELEEFNLKLTRRNADGTYSCFGHLPLEPGWWSAVLGYWFGGRLADDAGHLTATDAGNLAALDWVASYPKRFGQHEVSAFVQSSGNFASPFNPFIMGRVAMEMQGSWMANYIHMYSKGDFELGVAAFPTVTGTGPPVTMVASDILTIPAGAPHPREAFTFIAYTQRQKVIEKLCSAQYKFSPLVRVSENFWRDNPNPNIKIFYDLASSPGARTGPRLPIWDQYQNEMQQAVSEVWSGRKTPEVALRDAQDRMLPKLDRSLARWGSISGALQATWASEENPP